MENRLALIKCSYVKFTFFVIPLLSSIQEYLIMHCVWGLYFVYSIRFYFLFLLTAIQLNVSMDQKCSFIAETNHFTCTCVGFLFGRIEIVSFSLCYLRVCNKWIAHIVFFLFLSIFRSWRWIVMHVQGLSQYLQCA